MIVWTKERVDVLREIWPTFSASEIAERIGGISRNSVIGKAHRLGLKGKPRGFNAPRGANERRYGPK